MNITLAYQGHSDLTTSPTSETLSLAPNLAREPVAFDAELLKPLRFREAMSALHHVVVSDLRFKKREQQRLAVVRREAHKEAKAKIEQERPEVSADVQEKYPRYVKRYWKLR